MQCLAVTDLFHTGHMFVIIDFCTGIRELTKWIDAPFPVRSYGYRKVKLSVFLHKKGHQVRKTLPQNRSYKNQGLTS